MKHRHFISLMPLYHHEWAAQVLGMIVNPEKGPDLIDDDKIVEIKFSLTSSQKPEKKYPKDWTGFDYQKSYPQEWGRAGYWGLGLYELSKPIKSIDAIDMRDLESLVLSRELFLVEWDWMNQFPLHHTNGKTKHPEWNHVLVYPKFNLLPQTTQTYEVEKGVVHLTKGVPSEAFSFLTQETSAQGIPF